MFVVNCCTIVLECLIISTLFKMEEEVVERAVKKKKGAVIGMVEPKGKSRYFRPSFSFRVISHLSGTKTFLGLL